MDGISDLHIDAVVNAHPGGAVVPAVQRTVPAETGGGIKLVAFCFFAAAGIVSHINMVIIQFNFQPVCAAFDDACNLKLEWREEAFVFSDKCAIDGNDCTVIRAVKMDIDRLARQKRRQLKRGFICLFAHADRPAVFRDRDRLTIAQKRGEIHAPAQAFKRRRVIFQKRAVCFPHGSKLGFQFFRCRQMRLDCDGLCICLFQTADNGFMRNWRDRLQKRSVPADAVCRDLCELIHICSPFRCFFVS